MKSKLIYFVFFPALLVDRLANAELGMFTFGPFVSALLTAVLLVSALTFFTKRLPGMSDAAFGAVFMATDYVTSPTTTRGQYIFGAGIALLTILIRRFGGLPEGVMYAILLMNAAVPLINRVTRPRIFGAQS